MIAHTETALMKGVSAGVAAAYADHLPMISSSLTATRPAFGQPPTASAGDQRGPRRPARRSDAPGTVLTDLRRVRLPA